MRLRLLSLVAFLLLCCGACKGETSPGSNPEASSEPHPEALPPLWERDSSLAQLLHPNEAEPRAPGSPWKQDHTAQSPPPCEELRMGTAPSQKAPAGAANVILITVDTWRADRLGLYGSPRATDPWLQELARQSTVFERAVAPAPWTWPTMASLTSGLHPVAHGAEKPTDPLCEQAETLPELFAAAGWRTAMVTTNVYMKTHAESFHRGFEYYCPTNREQGADVVREVARTLDGFPSADPLFLWVHLIEPHCPYEPSPEALRAVTGKAFSSELGERGSSMAELLGDTNYCFWVPTVPHSGPQPGSESRPSARLQDYLDAYDGELRDIDEILRMLAEVLKVRGRWDDAWVAITGDHGEEFAEHGGFSHGEHLYQESTGVPLLVRPPQQPGQGVRSSKSIKTPVSLVDLPPTLLNAVGISVPPSWQGRDLGPALRGEHLPPRAVLSETYNGWSRLLEHNGHRLVVAGDHLEQANLFEATADPSEGKDLLDGLSPQLRGERAGELMGHLRATWKALAAGRICRPESVDISPEQEERLRALGYLGSE